MFFDHANDGVFSKTLCLPIYNLTPALHRTPSKFFSLDTFTVKAAAFRALVYRECKTVEDLSCSQALYAAFFARTAFLTSWFHQGLLFSLFFDTPSRFRPHTSSAHEMIAVLNNSHSVLMSSLPTGSFLYLDNTLSAYSFLMLLSAKASHLTL